MRSVQPYLVGLLISLLSCVGYTTQAAAEQAPVEDQSSNSPTATSPQAGEAENGVQQNYSRDLRVPYGSNAGVRTDTNVYSQSESIERQAYDEQPPPQPSSGASGNTQLFYKIQILEQEIRDLRGLLEEQSHNLDRLAREQKDQYLDIDRRLSQGSPNASNASSSVAASTTAGVTEPGPSTSDVVAVDGGDPETREYNLAFALTREKQYQEAIDGFTSMVNEFPNGAYTGNAFYWLGELYLALELPDIEKSRQSFVQVVNLFPDHAKVPDSLYKLGVVYHRLGDLIRARQYLNQVISQYPASASARLASSYLSDLP